MKFYRAIIALLLLCTLLCPIPCHAVPDTLAVSAKSAVLIDAADGSILYQKNAHERMGMASTTKIMTALVIAEDMPLDKIVSVPAEAVNTEGSSVYLTAGELLSIKELLYALMLASANDAAVALAVCHSGSVEKFADKMNEKALSLGLDNTHFVNPHGLYDDNHYTSAYDLAILSASALKNDILRQIVSTQKTTISHGITPENSKGETVRYLQNHNKLLRMYEGAIGMKTGFTKKTGRCLVSAAERDGLRLVAVTLSAPDDWNDHIAMLDYGYSTYERVVLLRAGEYCFEYPLSGGNQAYVTLTNQNEVCINLPKGSAYKVKYTVTSRHRFELAPLPAGKELAMLTITAGNKSLKVPLYTAYAADLKK